MRRPLRRRVPTVRLLLVAAALLGIALSTTTGGRADAQTGSSTSPGAPRLTLVRQTDWVGPDGVFQVAFKATASRPAQPSAASSPPG